MHMMFHAYRLRQHVQSSYDEIVRTASGGLTRLFCLRTRRYQLILNTAAHSVGFT